MPEFGQSQRVPYPGGHFQAVRRRLGNSLDFIPEGGYGSYSPATGAGMGPALPAGYALAVPVGPRARGGLTNPEVPNTMFRSRLLYSALFFVGLFAAPSVAQAQDPTRDRVQIALDVTDRRIEQAQVLVSSSDHPNAEVELNLAIDLQSRARSAFDATQLRISMTLTLEARGHADKAIAIIKGLPDPDRVLVQLERTRELIERARDRIEECGSDRAHALLRVALEMQVRAEAAAGEGRYLAALQLTLSARERALKALRMCNLEDNLHDAAERALARTDEVIGRARDRVAEAGDEAARAALSRAADLEAQAQAQFRSDHFEASLRLTLSARAFAHRAIRLCADHS